MLKHMDDKTISLELGDNRVLDFKRTSKTKFFKNGEEVKSPKFNPGDQISVEGPEEAERLHDRGERVLGEGRLGADTARSPEKDKAEGVPDTWKDTQGRRKDGKATPARSRPGSSPPSSERRPPQPR